MKFLFTVLIYFFSGIAGYAQDVHALLNEADRLEYLPDEKAALKKYMEVLKISPGNIYSINKCSELCSRIGQRETSNTKLRSDYYKAARTYAENALKIDPKNSEANCVMAIALGRSSLAKSGRDKIENAKEVKKYVDAAIAGDAKNFKAWHVLGRWQYEISNLNSLERGLVKLLYGGLPPATLKQSIASFEKARALRPEFLLNYFEMARAYKDNDDKTKAIAYLRLMITLPIQTEDDATLKEKAKALIKDWE